MAPPVILTTDTRTSDQQGKFATTFLRIYVYSIDNRLYFQNLPKMLLANLKLKSFMLMINSPHFRQRNTVSLNKNTGRNEGRSGFSVSGKRKEKGNCLKNMGSNAGLET